VLVISILAACGGGGGGGGSDDDNGNGGGDTGALAGRLWHDFYALDSVDGLQVSPLDGTRSRRVEATETAVPTLDGEHYVAVEYDLVNDTSLVRIMGSDGTTVVSQASFNGYVTHIRPSPSRLGDLLLTWASTAISEDGVLTVVDLPGRRSVQTLPDQVSADWLPDGRIVAVDSSGAVSARAVGQAGTTLGRMTVSGWTLRSITAAPVGQRLISRWVRLDGSGEVAETDLWISSADGTSLERLTSTGITSYGVWSPDGQSFAFDWDAANVCTGPGCVISGSCELHVAPATARQVDLGQSAVRDFTVTDAEGRRETLGCQLLGWTR
jgi:hypothetical protein